MIRVKGKFRESGSKINTLSVMRMNDKTSNGKLHIDDFCSAMNQLRITLKQDDIKYVNDVIDYGSGSLIDYRNFCDVLWDDKKIDVVALVADRRHQLGLDTGVDPKDAKAMINQSQAVDRPSGQRSLGQVSGLSDIMKKSEASFQPVKSFVDQGEAFDNFKVI